MAFNAGAVEGTLELDTKGFVTALRRAEKALDKIEKETKQTSKGFTSFRNAVGLLRDAMIILPGLFRAVSAPLRGLVGFLKDSSNAAAEFELVVRRLAVSMALQGIKNVKAFSKEMSAFASQIQNTTAFSEGMVLSVVQTLTVLGVQQKDLKKATTAVLNYSAAMGVEARQSAINFGKTLAGLTGELGEAFPALRELTVEQLKAGGAFDLANKSLGGFAKQVAKTTQGLRDQFINALDDLQIAVGNAINPVFDAITKAGTEAVKVLTATVKDNEGAITSVFEGIARNVLNVFRGLADAALDLPVLAAQAKAFVADVVAAVRTGGIDLEITLRQVFLGLREDILGIVKALDALPFVDLRAEISAFQNGIAGAAFEVEILKQNAERTKAPFIAARKAAEAQAAAARMAADAVRDQTDTTSALAVAYNAVVGFIDDATAGLDDMERDVTDVNLATKQMAGSVEETLNLWKAVNDATAATAKSTDQVAGSVRDASSATRQLASDANSAAQAFSNAASAAASVSAGDSRRAGPRAGLNLDDPFSGLAALGAQERGLRSVGGGFFGRFQRRSASAVTEQIRAVVEGQISNAFKDFTADILNGLNRTGVLDPAERSSIVDQRLAEAVRLGVLPERGAAQRGSASLLRF